MAALLNTRVSNAGSYFSSRATWTMIFLFVMVFIMGLVKLYSPDLGFHLKSAQWMLENRQFIYTDSFSYGSAGNNYYDLQWLYQLFIYIIYTTGGESLLIIVNALLITASLILVWVRFVKSTETGKTVIRQGLFAFMAILLVQPLTFEIRPHVISWIFLGLTLLFLEAYKRGNSKAVIALPIIMLIWVNTHSLSILGLVTIAIYNAGIYLEKRTIDKRLLLLSALSLGAFLINPYFIQGLAYPFTQLGIISGNNLLKSYIGEFQSPFNAEQIEMLGVKYFVSPLFIIHLAALLAVLIIIRSLRQKQYTDAILLAAYSVLLLLALKNYGYFLVACLPVLAKYSLAWFDDRAKRKLKQKEPPVSNKKTKGKDKESVPVIEPVKQKLYKRFSNAGIVIAILISITSMTDGYSLFRNSPFRFGLTMDKDQLPVEATAFLDQNQIKGKLLNHLDFGGYLMANYSEKVFIDGRLELLKKDFFKKYYESLTMRYGVQKLLDEYDPDIVIFPYIKATYWWDYFVAKRKRSGYKAVYFDGLSVIYVRSSAYPQLAELNEQDILRTVDPGAVMRVDECVETSKPKGIMVLISGLWQKQTFSIADQNRASYCFANGFDTAGLSYSVTGIERSTIHTPNIYKNLAVFYQDKKRYDLAQVFDNKSE